MMGVVPIAFKKIVPQSRVVVVGRAVVYSQNAVWTGLANHQNQECARAGPRYASPGRKAYFEELAELVLVPRPESGVTWQRNIFR
jgi:hypothetical protein